MGQGNPSTLGYRTITIKVPNPNVTFLDIQFESSVGSYAPMIIELQKEIKEVILEASRHELPPNYWINVRKLFVFLMTNFLVIKENIVKNASASDVVAVNNILSQLEGQTEALRNSFEKLLQDGISEFERNSSTANGLGACQEILRLFANRNGILFKNPLLSSGFLVTFGGLYKSFSKMWDPDYYSRRIWTVVGPLEHLDDTIEVYKNHCIQERLEGIDMIRTIRTHLDSLNDHDYSHEAQLKKSIRIFGETLFQDYYDKRAKDQINYSMVTFSDRSGAYNILTSYKNAVKMEYEVFFNAALCKPEQEGVVRSR